MTTVEFISSPVGYPELRRIGQFQIQTYVNSDLFWSPNILSSLINLPVLILINHSAPTSNTPIRNPPKAIPRTPDRPLMHGRAEKQTCKNNVCKLKFKKKKKEKDLLQLLQLQLRSIEHDLKKFWKPKILLLYCNAA